MARFSIRSSLCGLAFGLVAASPASALTFVFTDTSSTPMTATQLSAFQAAGNYWAGKFNDPVTVYLNIAFNALPQDVLGGTSSSFVSTSYTSVRSALTFDSKSTLDAQAVSSLAPNLSFLASQGDLSSRFDNDGSLNNTRLGLTTANAKAMGFNVGTSTAVPDARITFATGFASAFDYDRSNGVPSNKIDFVTVATHEIGHALGFVSGVDDVDFCALAAGASRCGLPDTVDRFENDWWYEPLDLFRYSAPGVRDVRVGGNPYFSVDGGVTAIDSFSTGAFNGNLWQASHFGPTGCGDPAPNLMRPFVCDGQFYDATARDMAAFDVIGWDVAAVPEPGTWALFGIGLAGLGWARRRQDRRPS